MAVELDSPDMTVERAPLRFDEFVAENAGRLLRFAYLLTGDHALAEDLVQEAFIKTHRRWGDSVEVDHPGAYLQRIVVHHYVGWRRLRKSSEVVGPIPDQSESDATDIIALRDLVWHALLRLPRRQRAVLVLRYYEGMDDAGISDVLGCAEGTVRSLAARAFAILRRHAALRQEIGTAEAAQREIQ